MSMHWLRILALVLICSLLTEFTSQAQLKEAKEGTATVSGRVTVKGEPAPGVTVVLQPFGMARPPNPGAIARAKTNENGQFRITGIAAGRYMMMAQAPGLIMPVERMGFPQGRTLYVAEDENVENIEIELKRGSVITGRITDSNSRPVVEERVELMKLDENGKPQQFRFGPMPDMQTTDDRGIYRIYGIPEGRYIVALGYSQGEGPVNLGGLGAYYPRTYYPNVTDQSAAKMIEVGEGECERSTLFESDCD
jgi:Carboxypeptidase regulatory-like domain